MLTTFHRAAFGVSRFRVLDSDTLPRGSSIIELVRFREQSTVSVLVAWQLT